MSDLQAIESVLEREGVRLYASIVQDPDNPRSFSIPVVIEQGAGGRLHPSKFQLGKLTDELRSMDIAAVFVVTDEKGADIARTAKTMLENRYSGLINNIFLDSSPERSTVWIEPRHVLQPQIETEVGDAVHELLQLLGISNHAVEFTSSANLPTPTAVMLAIRVLAPVTRDKLQEYLSARGMEIPNAEWLDRMLDRLRRADKIVRLHADETFALTFAALSAMGSKKTRNSPDVVRALALARGGV